jgi:ABC-type Fe3+/spermidine/putrescine transport system ATPase subunit
MTVAIQCTDLVKRFGAAVILDRLNWSVPAGGVVGVVGPSGSGKTTLLRIVAGLEKCSGGKMTLTASPGVDPRGSTTCPSVRARTAVSMVFQNLALWPHLTAWQHLQCVMSSMPDRHGRRSRIEQALRETRLPGDCWKKRPAELSGGEAQRLAIARALVTEPALLLLDEPLAQVDSPLRAELLRLIQEVIQRRPVTVIYVTHHCREAMELCQRIAVLKQGRIALEGTPEDVFWAPADRETARLTGPIVEFPRQWLEEGRAVTALECSASQAALLEEAGNLLFRPQQIRFVEPQGSNQWQVRDCRPDGAAWLVTLSHEARQLRFPSAAPPRGQTVGIELAAPRMGMDKTRDI